MVYGIVATEREPLGLVRKFCTETTTDTLEASYPNVRREMAMTEKLTESTTTSAQITRTTERVFKSSSAAPSGKHNA
ncbi:hypothetical protein FRC20_005545 [Serendipita sp. 405]|nr:hypothetical protein FRC20_005545 [Serendipita sp. 405]